ncbi:MAG TPA: metalloregulator ArsR/SmtB family transcription factor [Alphaproteobacteria bacterium]|nr:metalloregulator ArsR/SmtB family transcription factor [Alphaproteobacteria bacterium]
MISKERVMDANIAAPAALIADPARAAMLMALFDGRAQPASTLAAIAGISPQAASNHLAKLRDGGMVAVEIEGRHRYYRLAHPEIAAALEALACAAPRIRSLDPPLSREARRLRDARSCYDHLAGRLGVAIADALIAQDYLRAASDPKGFAVTETGKAWFAELGIDVGTLKPGKHGHARRCLDWTERRHHVAGPLGHALLDRLLDLKWVRRDGIGRKLELTEAGRLKLRDRLGVDIAVNVADRADAA